MTVLLRVFRLSLSLEPWKVLAESWSGSSRRDVLLPWCTLLSRTEDVERQRREVEDRPSRSSHPEKTSSTRN